MEVLGVLVMVMGLFVLLLGIGVVVLAPWKGISQAQSITPPVDIPELEGLEATVTWLLFTFLALIVNLFLSGIALILVGYGLYKVKGEEHDSQ